METYPVLPDAQPFFFEGNEIGVLISHGFTGTTQSMRYLGEKLAHDGGFTVIGPRLKGHGTDPRDMAQSTAEDWIRSIEEALETLRARCSTVFITGLSMGGTLTLYTAAMHADIIKGAIPINAAIQLHSPDMAMVAYMQGAPEMLPGIGSDIKQPGSVELAYPLTPVRAIREIYALMGVTHDLLPRVVCPTLIFQSKDDHVVPPPNGPFILEHIGATDKRLLWLENSYHVATLDNDKELIANESLRFIQAHS